MSFTKDKDSDNYMTNKIEWERIKEYIPTDKKYGVLFMEMENKKNILKKWDLI